VAQAPKVLKKYGERASTLRVEVTKDGHVVELDLD
jgi:hypothetical protein